MKYFVRLTFLILACCMVFPVASASGQSVRKERRLILEGNKLYLERKYSEASQKYKEALNVNGNSAVGRYNLGLSQIKQVTNPQDTTPRTRGLLEEARRNLASVASMAKEKPGLASKANYNLGNLEYNTKEYKNAIDYYKQALRINPNDESARKNLRIAQKQLQNQDQNKNQNQNQNQDQNKDQNQDQNKDKGKNKDQNNNKQDQKENKPQEKNISPQTANQILQAMDNKENQTRARVNRANKGDKSQGGSSSRRKW